MKQLRLLPLVLAALVSVASAQTQPSLSPVTTAGDHLDDRAEIHKQTFQLVWQTIKDKHFDPTFGGVNWDGVRDRYAPRVDGVKTDRELHSLLQQMLDELKQSHFSIIPPEAIIDDVSREPQTGGIGIDLRFIEDLAVVTRVETGSVAAAAGIRQGFVITQVDGTPVSRIVERFGKGKQSPERIRLSSARAVLARINGKPASQVEIGYRDERNQTRSATLVRTRLKGEMAPPVGNFPAQYTEFEARTLEGGIGYIRFNMFAMPLMPKIRQAIRSMSDASGLIFDLRGNPGGFGGMSSGIAGLLEATRTSLGTMTMRNGRQNFAVIPQANPYLGPVVILIDGLSGSTSEVFSAGMQEIGRAVIVGEKSVGAALPSVFQKLPTGARFQYAIADFRTPKGVLIEGRGVIPNVEIKLTREMLLKGGDPQLASAAEQIRKLSAKRLRKAA